MESLLIALFLILFIYLVFQMCRESDAGESPVHPETDFDKSAAVLDEISKLGNRDLYRLKDALYDLKSALNKLDERQGLRKPGTGLSCKTAGMPKKNEGRQSLRKTLRAINEMENNEIEHRKPSFSKFQCFIIQFALILITLLLILH
ncbi:MAG: hypothetical protein C4530_18920 [Desulfobacteraceae bacterium]|nr:MAG: hypothetical protein C4530_18920 [Desulfobacteraceae bacterium]